MNKTKVLRFRCTEEQMRLIKEKAEKSGGTISGWGLQSMLGSDPEKDRLEKNVVEVVDGVETWKAKCQSPGCSSTAVKPYQRSTGKFYLCDTHKP